MWQSDRHLFAHSETEVAGSSVASSPTTSRSATPTPVTPEQSSAFEMARQASGHESTFIVTPRARPRSSTSAASNDSGASREADPLAVLVASFLVPPVAKEGVLVCLEQMRRPRNGRHLFNHCPSGLGPPPDCPLPPLPPALGSPDPSSEVEQAKQHTDALGLALTYASPLGSTDDSGSSDPTSLLTRQRRPAFIPRPRSAIPPPPGPPPAIPLPRIPTSSTSSCRRESRELATGALWPANCGAGGTDVEPRRRPRSNDSQDPINDTSCAGPQDTSDSSFDSDKDDDASPARGAESHQSRRRANDETAPLSARSSSDLEVIKADLAELLAPFRPTPTRDCSPRPREDSRTRFETEVATSSAPPEHDSESPPRYAEERKSSVMSMRNSTSTASSSSTHSNTTRGYKAYKLVLKEQSPASLSPTTSRRSSLSTLSTTASKPANTDSDSEELFDLSFDSASQDQPWPKASIGSSQAQCKSGRSTGSLTTVAKDAAGTARAPDNSRWTSWASQPPTGTTPKDRALEPHQDAAESNSRALRPEDPAPTANLAAPPLRRTLIKPLITASNAQSTYLPSSPKRASRIPPPPVDSSRLARSLPLPRSPAGAR